MGIFGGERKEEYKTSGSENRPEGMLIIRVSNGTYWRHESDDSLTQEVVRLR